MSAFSFEVLATDGAARLGRVATAHGEIATPAFMPVGTAASVKAMTPGAVAETGTQILLANTYHLMLRPGAETVERLGGLHEFMNWPGPILTDSGGFQVMSLAKLRDIAEDGVTFKSHIDGSRHQLTPERCIDIQRALDADISMVLDECTPFPATAAEAASSMRLSMRWAERSKAAFEPRPGHALFGIVQGGCIRRCAPSRRRRFSTSASTATPSAALRSARGARSCSRRSSRCARCCPPRGRAT